MTSPHLEKIRWSSSKTFLQAFAPSKTSFTSDGSSPVYCSVYQYPISVYKKKASRRATTIFEPLSPPLRSTYNFYKLNVWIGAQAGRSSTLLLSHRQYWQSNKNKKHRPSHIVVGFIQWISKLKRIRDFYEFWRSWYCGPKCSRLKS